MFSSDWRVGSEAYPTLFQNYLNTKLFVDITKIRSQKKDRYPNSFLLLSHCSFITSTFINGATLTWKYTMTSDFTRWYHILHCKKGLLLIITTLFVSDFKLKCTGQVSHLLQSGLSVKKDLIIVGNWEWWMRVNILGQSQSSRWEESMCRCSIRKELTLFFWVSLSLACSMSTMLISLYRAEWCCL
jgi:hypothetical protein